MYSDTEICNMALGWLGANAIVDLQEESDIGELCRNSYPSAIRLTLEARDWTFATKRATLVPLVVAPAFGYAYGFQTPADNLRILSVSKDEKDYRGVEWVLEEKVILCDYNPLYIRYIKHVTDPTKFSPAFAVAVAETLASFLAMPITENPALVKLYDEKLKDMIMMGGSLDGVQGTSPKFRSHGLADVRRTRVVDGTGNYI